MKFPIFLVALALLVSLAKAQPVLEADQELKVGLDQLVIKDEAGEVYQDDSLVAEPTELADAIEELNRQEQKDGGDVVTSAEQHNRQKRAVCRCVRRGRTVVCVCRR